MDEFVKTIRETNEIVEHQETQLQNIHQTLLKQEKVLVHGAAEWHNMVDLLRADTYVHRD